MSKGRGSLVKLGLLGVGCLALGTVVGPKLTGGTAASATGPTTTTTLEPGPVVSLEAITLNLADGRLLQVGLALELASGTHAEEPDDDDPTRGYAKALDATIEVLGRRTMGELADPMLREEAKADLLVALEERYHGEVAGVFFHQFVMQ